MNRLAGETSPYLLQHADNPVDWYPWGDEAFARARDEDRPILLSIGYAACHWCHVMEHESFEDDETAALMNERFVNVKVDREERPDVDARLHGRRRRADRPRRLADDRLPHAGRRAVPRRDVLPARAAPRPPELPPGARRRRRTRTASGAARSSRQARALTDAVAASAGRDRRASRSTEELLARAELGLRQGFDPVHGGWGDGAEVPARADARVPAPARRPTTRSAMVRTTLDGMAAGGMYDLVGGGFHRYSVDAQWLVPHFEKMLYDNALLAATYLHALGALRARSATGASSSRRSTTCCASSASTRARSPRRRTPTPTASRA